MLKTLNRNKSTLTNLVKQNILSRLSDRFAIFFDEKHITFEAYFLAFLATYLSKSTSKYCLACPAVSLLKDEREKITDEHIRFLKLIFGMFVNSKSNFITLIGDNCSLNPYISKTLGIPLLCYASHRLPLTVKNVWMEKNLHFLSVSTNKEDTPSNFIDKALHANPP